MLKKYLYLFIFFLNLELLANQGLQLFNDEKYDAAFRASYSSAISEDKISQYVIGRIILEGMGSSFQDKNKGLKLIKASAKSNYLKATMFLANTFYEGNIVEQDHQQALKYMKQSEKLGHKGYNKKITKLTTKMTGAYSKSSCVRYNKKDRKLADKVATCISKGFLEGNAFQYFLIAFDEGKNSSLVNALRISLQQDDPDKLSKVIKRIHTFYKREKKLTKLISVVKDLGYDYSSCGASIDEFGFENAEQVNVSHCVLAALSGDKKASAEVAIWFRDGINDFPRSQLLSNLLIEKAEAGGSADAIEQILKSYEIDPKKHFQKIKSYSGDVLMQEIIAEALKLEAKLIAEKKFKEFAKNKDDIVYVLERVKWDNLDEKVLANIYVIYNKMLFKKNSSFSLTDNINLIPFTKTIYDNILIELGQIEATKFLENRVIINCKALDFAINNEGLISLENLQLAQNKMSNKCNSSGVDFATLVNKSIKNFDAYKILLEKKINLNINCNEYKVFLKNGGVEYLTDNSKLKVNYEEINKKCTKTDATVSYLLGEIYYKIGNYDKAFKYSRNSCEAEKSIGCELIAYILLEGKSSYSDTYDSKKEREYQAMTYLKMGVKNEDIKSIALLSDVLGDLFSPSDKSKKEYKKLINKLKNDSTKNIAAEIRIKSLCFKNTDLIKSTLFGKNCNNVCRWAHREIKENVDLDYGSIRALGKINNKRSCRSLMSKTSSSDEDDF